MDAEIFKGISFVIGLKSSSFNLPFFIVGLLTLMKRSSKESNSADPRCTNLRGISLFCAGTSSRLRICIIIIIIPLILTFFDRAPSSQMMSHAEDDARGGVTSSMGMPTSIADANDIKWLPNQKRAAVLLCLFQGAGGELRVILTKRAGSLSSHSGEVALPGGKRDEGDEDDKATALREAQEEIGLEPLHVKIVTVLEPFLSKHLLTVTPVVAILPEHHKFEPRPNAGEVDAIFDVPLEMFLKDERHRFEDRQWLDVKYRVHFFEFEAADGKKFTIWGLTASILIRAASIILQRPADFPEFNPNFDTLAKQAMQGKDHKM